MSSWTAIALGRDVPAGTTRSVILDGLEIVVWRGADGAAHVWEDRCPHRGMRLSFGFVRGNALNCLYHGWEYGAGAQCVRIPAHPDLIVPPTIRANAYAAAEQGGLIWVNLAQDTGTAPPPIPETALPVVSLAFDVGIEVVRDDIGDEEVARMPIRDGMVYLAPHRVSAEKTMVHVVAYGDARQAWSFARSLRHTMESERAA